MECVSSYLASEPDFRVSKSEDEWISYFPLLLVLSDMYQWMWAWSWNIVEQADFSLLSMKISK